MIVGLAVRSTEPDPGAIVDVRLRRASRRLKVASWLCAIHAIGIAHRGLEAHVSTPLGGAPDLVLIAMCSIVAVAPMLAAWGRVGRRRRAVLGLLGLLGLGLMIALVRLDMHLVERAVVLGIETAGWEFECVLPRGNHQAAFAGFAGFALILRIEAALVDTLATPRGSARRRQLAGMFLALGLAAGAAVPFVRFAIQDHVYLGLCSPLPAYGYLSSFAVFELCARLGLVGRRSGPSKPTKSATQRREQSEAVARPRPRPGRRLSPDPAALAQGHRALVRARRWALVAAGLGLLGLARLLMAAATPGGEGEWSSVLIVAVVVVILGLIVMPKPGRASTGSPALGLPAELEWPGLRALVELLDRARAGLEHGDDEVFEMLYGDLDLQFAELDARELAWVEERGLTRTRLHGLLDRGADHGGGFDADLRRALHRELSSILAALRGHEQVDPYRADLRTSSFVEQLGLGWLRADTSRQDEELRSTRRIVVTAVIASFVSMLGVALIVALDGTGVPLAICVPGRDGCRWALGPSEVEVITKVVLVCVPLVPWVVGVAHRRVAERSFAAALPRDDRNPRLPQPSPSFASLRDRLVHSCISAAQLRAVLGLMLLGAIPVLVSCAGFNGDDWLADALGSGLGLDLTITSMIALTLVCRRPLLHGLRRASARLWLGWLRSGWADDSPQASALAELVRCRVELATALPLTDAMLDSIARIIAAAPLGARDADAILAHIEHAHNQLHHLERDWLLELDALLVTCELSIADGPSI